MTDRHATPIEDYLDELHTGGLTRVDAERAAVRRLGPASDLARGSWRRSFGRLVAETMLGAALLGGCGLVAVGLSGGLVAGMNALFGDGFVGGATVLGTGTGAASITETAQDAVVLRRLAGVIGILVLAGYALMRRNLRPAVVLPWGLIDALGAAAFAGASIDRAVAGTGGHGVGFFLSGALVSLVGATAFCGRATRALLPTH